MFLNDKNVKTYIFHRFIFRNCLNDTCILYIPRYIYIYSLNFEPKKKKKRYKISYKELVSVCVQGKTRTI